MQAWNGETDVKQLMMMTMIAHLMANSAYCGAYLHNLVISILMEIVLTGHSVWHHSRSMSTFLLYLFYQRIVFFVSCIPRCVPCFIVY